MQLNLKRIIRNEKCTIGLLFVDSIFECFTLEDPKQEIKIKGNTRIDSGKLKILIRDKGPMNKKYKSKFPDFHKGMLWLKGVVGFLWVYFHIGNYPEDTEGCLLVGDGVSEKFDYITNSKKAYSKLYKKVINALEKEYVYITIEDEEGS